MPRLHKDPDMERWVAEIRVRAKRRIGELSGALETVQGCNLPNVPSAGQTGKREALTAAGLTKTEAHRCEQLSRVPEAAFEAYIATKTAAGKTVTADEMVRIPNANGTLRKVLISSWDESRKASLASFRNYRFSAGGNV